MYAIVGDTWNLVYPLVTRGFGDAAPVDARMAPDLLAQVIADYQAMSGYLSFHSFFFSFPQLPLYSILFLLSSLSLYSLQSSI